jgi:uncharacterized protein (DUF1778 family)
MLMTVPVKIMVTEEQKTLLDEAANSAMLDFSAWARPVLLQAAQDQLAKTGQKKSRQK